MAANTACSGNDRGFVPYSQRPRRDDRDIGVCIRLLRRRATQVMCVLA
jgi:hypothetical protein